MNPASEIVHVPAKNPIWEVAAVYALPSLFLAFIAFPGIAADSRWIGASTVCLATILAAVIADGAWLAKPQGGGLGSECWTVGRKVGKLSWFRISGMERSLGWLMGVSCAGAVLGSVVSACIPSWAAEPYGVFAPMLAGILIMLVVASTVYAFNLMGFYTEARMRVAAGDAEMLAAALARGDRLPPLVWASVWRNEGTDKAEARLLFRSGMDPASLRATVERFAALSGVRTAGNAKVTGTGIAAPSKASEK